MEKIKRRYFPGTQAHNTEQCYIMKCLAPVLCVLASCCVRVAHGDLAFYVMGDVPYASWEEDVLDDQMVDMDGSAAKFTVHLGDMQRGTETGCPLSRFQNVRDILERGPLPTFVLAGDNDYLECPNRKAAWQNYLDTFVGFEDQWSHNIDVYRRTSGSSNAPGGEEMFAFYEEGILFVSLAVMRGGGNFNTRVSASKDWLENNLEEYKDDEYFRGVIMFSHAEEDNQLDSFFDDIGDIFENAGVDVPAAYLCGDAHHFRVRKNSYYFTYIQVDQGACADPLLIEVAPLVDGVTELFDTGSSRVFGDGLFRYDRQGGSYGFGKCD